MLACAGHGAWGCSGQALWMWDQAPKACTSQPWGPSPCSLEPGCVLVRWGFEGAAPTAGGGAVGRSGSGVGLTSQKWAGWGWLRLRADLGCLPPPGAGTTLSQPAGQPATPPSHPPSSHPATRRPLPCHQTHQPAADDHSSTGHLSSLPADTNLRCPGPLGAQPGLLGSWLPGGR